MWSIRLLHSNIKVCFFAVFFSVNFLIQNWWKLDGLLSFFGSFAPHLQIKLSMHASNFNSRFVSMSELELFLLMGILTPNFNTMDLGKFLEKNQNLQIQIVASTLKVISGRTMSKKKKWKKVINQDFMGKTNYFWEPCPSAVGQIQPHGCM
jgi:hypothetical protein